MSREHGNIWPLVSVAGGAILVLVVVPLAIQRLGGSRMATVDAHVTIGDTASGSSIAESRSSYRWPDSEVPRTAETARRHGRCDCGQHERHRRFAARQNSAGRYRARCLHRPAATDSRRMAECPAGSAANTSRHHSHPLFPQRFDGGSDLRAAE